VITRDGDRIMVAGAVTLQNVTNVLAEGQAHIRAGASVIDLAAVTELDSSLLAAVLAWIREARQDRKALAVANMPKDLQTLAQLYGIENLLPVQSAA
jgi:phospholipid transport system transporter-binding protein